jgi:cytidylate kinase
MVKEFIVAIDGTAGSGKSTTARLAARELGFLHLDTGAMYRAVTVKVIREKLDLNDLEKLARVLAETEIDLVPRKNGNRIILDGEDVTEAVRTPEVDRMVSHVSVVSSVREKLVAEQRRIAKGKQVVCEGRDIGSVVFPHADVKFYVDADLSARADRRHKELRTSGDTKGIQNSEFRIQNSGAGHVPSQSAKSIADNLTERDYIDSTRTHSPLTRVRDAIPLDTTNLTVGEEVAIVVLLVRMRMREATGDRR